MFKVSCLIVEGPGGRLFGPFGNLEMATEWLNNEGRNLAGPLNIRVVYSGALFEQIAKAVA